MSCAWTPVVTCGWGAKYEHLKNMYDRLYEMQKPPLDTICFMEKWCQEMRAMHGGDDIHADVDPSISKLHSPLGPPQDKDKGDVYQPTASSALTYLHMVESCTTPLRSGRLAKGQNFSVPHHQIYHHLSHLQPHRAGRYPSRRMVMHSSMPVT